MQKKELIFKGNEKQVFATDHPDQVIFHFSDVTVALEDENAYRDAIETAFGRYGIHYFIQNGRSAVTGPLPAFLNETLKASTKPVIVGAHHDLNETKIADILKANDCVAGHINGHHHYWTNYEKDGVKALILPSNGHWGDIGYTVLRFEEDHAEAQIHEYEFFFPKPAAEGEPIPAQWKMIEQEHRDRICFFEYR